MKLSGDVALQVMLREAKRKKIASFKKEDITVLPDAGSTVAIRRNNKIRFMVESLANHVGFRAFRSVSPQVQHACCLLYQAD